MASVGARGLDKGYRHGCLKSGKWQEATKVKSGKALRCPHVKFDPSSPGPVAKPPGGPRFKIQDFLEVLGQKSWNPPWVSRFLAQDPQEILNLGTRGPRFLAQDLQEILNLGSWTHGKGLARLEIVKSLHLSDLIKSRVSTCQT